MTDETKPSSPAAGDSEAAGEQKPAEAAADEKAAAGEAGEKKAAASKKSGAKAADSKAGDSKGGRPAGGGRGSAPPRRTVAGPREIRPAREGRGGRDRGGRGGRQHQDDQEGRLEERVVKINRCSTVVKGGRRFSFSALVVLGDREGRVGVGFGKANEVPPTVEKAMKNARKNFQSISLAKNTIPHKIVGEFRSSRVVLVPASEGTGIIAGASVRAVVECAGVKDVLTKVYGSTNPLNVVKATLNGLKRLRSREEVMRLRGVEIAQ